MDSTGGTGEGLFLTCQTMARCKVDSVSVFIQSGSMRIMRKWISKYKKTWSEILHLRHFMLVSRVTFYVTFEWRCVKFELNNMNLGMRFDESLCSAEPSF